MTESNDKYNQNNENDENYENDENDIGDNKKFVEEIYRFSMSCIGLLDLLEKSVNNVVDDNSKFLIAKDKFIESVGKFKKNVKNYDECDQDFTHIKIIKKAFSVLKTKESCQMVQTKDSKLFDIRDESNQIVTVLKGINIRFGYRFLKNDDVKLFWQYFGLFTCTVFKMIKENNPQKINKAEHILKTIEVIESELNQTGIMFNNIIFNPFIGIGSNGSSYSMDDLIKGEIKVGEGATMESLMNMMGINKFIDESKIQDELKNITSDDINNATDKITELLGSSGNPEIKEVCHTLINDIFNQINTNGIQNIGTVLMNVTENAKNTMDINKMTMASKAMGKFFANSENMIKEMKDDQGNPIGQDLFNKMKIPLNVVKMMNQQTGVLDEQIVS
jgi:hypothetical protein